MAYTILAGQHGLSPLDPYRAELMALHDNSLESNALEAVPGRGADMDAETSDTVEPEHSVEEKIVSIHARNREAERRASRRIAANDPAMLLGAGAEPVEVRIADFSHTGMRLGLANGCVAPDTIVSIVFPDNEVIQGEVRWNSGEGRGIRVVGVGDETVFAPTEAANTGGVG